MSQPPPMGAPVTLDDPQTLALDSLGMLDVIAGSAEALDRGRAAAEAVDLFFPASAVREVVICGMGGSAVAGDLVLGAYRQRLRHPAEVVRDYYLPGWVGEDTLCVLSSYSGETEETLTCAMQATERNALCVAITSGGKLAGQYREMGVPVVDLPAGLQPRAALIHLLIPLAVILSRMEVIGDIATDLDEARGVLERAVAAYRPEVPQTANAAKQLATFLGGSLPLVWGADLTAAVAMRWKCQLNENAKMPAFWATLPELDHNEIVGFEDTGELGPLTQVVELREPRHHRQIERRFDLTRELVEPRVRGVTAITAEGESALARMLDLVMLGDYVSLYLGLLRGHDPGPVELIAKLKERLATTGYGRIQGAE
jgi:glucose/mannose-6-phosphate isomerase